MATRGPRTQRIVGTLGILGTLFAGDLGTARAQPSTDSTARARFETLAREIKPGQKLVVLDTAGREHTGRLAELSGRSIALRTDSRRVELTPAEVLRIEKRRTAVWEGLLIGAGAGALLGPTVGRESCLNAPIWQCVAKGMAGLGLTGAALGSLKEVRTPLYQAPRPAGVVAVGSGLSAAGASMSVSLRF